MPSKIMYTNSIFIAEVKNESKLSLENYTFFSESFLSTSLINVYHTKGSSSLIKARGMPIKLLMSSITWKPV